MDNFHLDLLPNLSVKGQGSSSSNFVFARHETFHPRFGWLKKGFDAAVQEPGFFLQEDAHIRLGVGKNMARSIRYWCSAFKVLEDYSSSNKSRFSNPSELGKKLLDDNSWDAFLEDPASLWLLHWNLLKPPCYATAWYFTFNIFRQVNFAIEDLFNALNDYTDNVSNRVADSSLRKDITCLLRMYVEQGTKTGPNEDSLDCPFTELGILSPTGDTKHYTFRVGPKVNLPAEIVVAACLEYASWVGREQRTIAISRLTFDAGSPGMAFKLSESAVAEALEHFASRSDSVVLSDTAGLIQLSYNQDPAVLAEEVLNRYYQTRRSEAKL